VNVPANFRHEFALLEPHCAAIQGHSGKGMPMRPHEPLALRRARKLRRQMTHAEALLWIYLRRDRTGARIRRQHPIGPFIADFACLPARLVIEVDGPTHEGDAEVARDRRREGYLRSRGWHVVRVTNQDVYANLNGVLEGISELVRERCAPPREIRAKAE
jgi:very-short-patch-repair endonuclease